MQYLLSLPPAMAREFGALGLAGRRECLVAADPAGAKLGSGGGIAHLLAEAARVGGVSVEESLERSRKLVVLAGGQSRRLPAYAAISKLLLPFKVLRGSYGQRLDQTLLDLQLPAYERVLNHAPPGPRVLVTSGDVFLRFGKELPAFPEVDVLPLGMWVRPEIATHFGVAFMRREEPGKLAFFLQKPSVEEIHDLGREHSYLVDTGMWLLSARAIGVLLRKCGWVEERGERGGFAHGVPDFYELYAGLGPSLGDRPHVHDVEIGALSSAIVALPEAEFHHLGTSRQLIEAISTLESQEWLRAHAGAVGPQPHPDQHVQNSVFQIPLRRQENHSLWVENSHVPATWKLASEHVITNVPHNDWALALPAGFCLDVLPVGEGAEFCLRPYGIDDAFKGAIGNAATQWLGAPVAQWFTRRGLPLAMTGDLQQSAIFPVMRLEAISGNFVNWLFHPEADPDGAAKWLAAPRLSAEELTDRVNLRRLYAQRQENLDRSLASVIRNARFSVFFRLDLQATAEQFAGSEGDLPPALAGDRPSMEMVRDQMFRAAIFRRHGDEAWREHEGAAFHALQELIISEAQLAPARPQRCLLEDQIIWGRSPVRLDLAGGWSDTPPYCLEHGGKVVNLAVNLNGQPPVQVFAKMGEASRILLRSIDLGVEQSITSYEQLARHRETGDPFSLAKAALALAGFLPRFQGGATFATLAEQLADFGGGLEITLLSAVPKGSGLGTSSILASTLLGVLNELGGLGWDQRVLFSRTLALEQMLTTGGGWQDQAGGMFRGLKLVETKAGLSQAPTLRWLPEHLFRAGDPARSRVLLYYTGLTRLAKNILQEIVRGMFLNSARHLEIIDAISRHAEATFEAIQRNDWEAVCAAVRTSWELNQQLDAGTNPPAVQEIVARIRDEAAAAKLLGAGGGGYLLILAKDESAALRIRKVLTANPPNDRARFIDCEISDTGLQITRS